MRDPEKVKAARRRYYQKHKAEIRARNDAWDKAHPDKVTAYKHKWKEANREQDNAISLRWYYANRDVALARGKEWAKRNPKKVRERGRRHDAKPHRKAQRGDGKARVRRYHERHLEKVRRGRCASEAKRRQDPAQRMIDAIRRRMRMAAHGKSKGAFKLLGYSGEELRAHLEAQFQPGMSWDNYGLRGEKWHIDHKRPVSTFRLPDELIECFGLSNLQPLWARDNLAKNRRIEQSCHGIAPRLER